LVDSRSDRTCSDMSIKASTISSIGAPHDKDTLNRFPPLFYPM
jgi:hypothetical protein